MDKAIREICELFELEKGDNVYLSSDISRFIYLFKKNKKKLDINEIIDCFQEMIGKEGTLLIPTFSFEFSSNGYYDYKNSKCNSGAIGNVALGRNDFVRTSHPMHSFAVWGKSAAELTSLCNIASLGKASPFEWCRDNCVKQVILGTDYNHAMTFCHYVETVCEVPFRFHKSFKGTYVTVSGEKEERTYDYYARKLEIEIQGKFNRIGKILENKGISRKIDYEGIENYIVNLPNSYPIIEDDILHNQCKNLFDFNVSREKLFEGFGE